MVTDEMKNKNIKHIYKVHKKFCEENVEIINRTAMNTCRTSMIDDRTDLNSSHTSDQKHKLEVPEMEKTQ